ncbi:MAG: hypothetical protein LBP79_07800 [Clostridiales bacterium]|jgi:hypothetical protein|nr:hypothetical protein [Clostridiales bacterium]
MSKERRAFDALEAACLNLINSKMILSSDKIRGILNIIASNEVLKGAIADAMTDFNYKRELLNAVYKFGSLIHFKLPPQPKKAVALVVNMLYEFDNGALNFVEFVTTTFAGVRTEERYQNFVKAVVEPFIERARELIFAEKTTALSAEEKIDRQAYWVNGAMKDRAEYLVGSMHDLVVECAVPDAAAAHFMIDGLIYTMEIGDLRLVKIAFLGLKSILNDYKQFAAPIADLEGIIRMYSVK